MITKVMVAAVGFLVGCTATPKPPAAYVPLTIADDTLRHCDMQPYSVRLPPVLRTPKTLAHYANALELSREAINRARNQCNARRARLVNLIDLGAIQ